MIAFDVDPCRADAVCVALGVPHLGNRVDNLVQAVDKAAYAPVGAFICVDVIQILCLVEQFVDVAS